MATKVERRLLVDQIFILLGCVVAIFLVIVGVLAFYGANFAKNQVRTELAAQKIYFPTAGSPNFNAEDYPDLQQYAGQLVDDGVKAKAYANGFIGRHLKKIADGKTYSEVSALAAKDQSNQQLQQQKQTLFQGETLRGMLLGNGYAYWTFGTIAYYTAIASFAGAIVMIVLVMLGLNRVRRP